MFLVFYEHVCHLWLWPYETYVNTPSLTQGCRGWARQTLGLIVSELIDLIIQNFAFQISNITRNHGFPSKTSKIWRLLWYIQRNKIKMDLVGFLFCFQFYYIPPFTLGLVLLSSDWPDCQAPASDWSILAVGKYLQYLWLFTSSVCYKTIEQSSYKINKTRQIQTKTRNMSRKVVKLQLNSQLHLHSKSI